MSKVIDNKFFISGAIISLLMIGFVLLFKTQNITQEVKASHFFENFSKSQVELISFYKDGQEFSKKQSTSEKIFENRNDSLLKSVSYRIKEKENHYIDIDLKFKNGRLHASIQSDDINSAASLTTKKNKNPLFVPLDWSGKIELEDAFDHNQSYCVVIKKEDQQKQICRSNEGGALS